MNNIYKFIAGNSKVTPIGIAVAVIVALLLRTHSGGWISGVYLTVLLLTLAASTFEPVQ